MNILFIHQNFPAQYKHIAPALAARGHKIVALTVNPAPPIEGVTILRYAIEPLDNQSTPLLAREFSVKVTRGSAAARAALALKERGFSPQVICAHPGWGESLFLKDVWPEAKLLCFCEFYYNSEGSDLNFDPEFSDFRFENLARIRVKNANNLLCLEAADAGISPTDWQKSQFPDWMQRKTSVIHDGIDTELVAPDRNSRIILDQTEFRHGDELVTFVNRSLEPYRGYHVFMRALPGLLKRRPNAHVLIVGREGTSYGAAPRNGKSWKQIFLDEVAEKIDPKRVHFLGSLPYDQFLRVLQVSAAHVYLTYPFVLSWSMLEAMSAGCIVIGSRTHPVEEVIKHKHNGLLVDFFSPGNLVETISDVLAHPAQYAHLREQARETIVRDYDLRSVCLPKHVELIESLGR